MPSDSVSGAVGPGGGQGRPPARRLADLEHKHRRVMVRFAALRIVLTVGLLLGAYYLLPFESEGGGRIALQVVILIPMASLAIIMQVRAVATAEYPQIRAAEALASVAVVLIVVFAGSYLALSNNNRAAFSERLNHTDSLYFTVTTLATVGYGDIAPRSDTARVAAMVQMTVNVIVLGAGVRLIVHTARYRLDGSNSTTATIE